MTTLEILKAAIDSKKPISFTYRNKKGEMSFRVANPYVVYLFTSKDGEQTTRVDVVQTGGDSDTSDSKPFPCFKNRLAIEDILDLKILDEPTFGPLLHADYKPESDWYQYPLAKV